MRLRLNRDCGWPKHLQSNADSASEVPLINDFIAAERFTAIDRLRCDTCFETIGHIQCQKTLEAFYFRCARFKCAVPVHETRPFYHPDTSGYNIHLAALRIQTEKISNGRNAFYIPRTSVSTDQDRSWPGYVSSAPHGSFFSLIATASRSPFTARSAIWTRRAFRRSPPEMLPRPASMAKLIGEDVFPAVVHEGERESIYISVIGRSLLVVVFDERSTLGLVKIRTKRAQL